MPSEGLDTCNFSHILKFSCLSSLVQYKNAFICFFYAASNFFAYLLLIILTSETYIIAAFDVMFYRCSFALVVIFRKIIGIYCKSHKTRKCNYILITNLKH